MVVPNILMRLSGYRAIQLEEKIRFDILKLFRICRHCRKTIEDYNRRIYCSQKCLNKFWHKRSWRTLRKAVYKMYTGLCGICWEKVPDTFEIDHMIPRSKGGSDYSVYNLRPVHISCHKEKTKMDLLS